ncbi:MAG: OmpA family protein [Saprospiraceae bacterium]|nr:OmpA family protein [Saprospiraceae bacterium]
MKINVSTLVLLLCSGSIFGQNLIVNGDFEQHLKGFAVGWEKTDGTPDYINLNDDSDIHKSLMERFTNSDPNNIGYVGVVVTNNGSEIFHQELEDRLEKGEIYELSAKILAGWGCQVGLETITVALSPNPLQLPIDYKVKCLKLKPIHSVIKYGEWTEVKVVFKAIGYEKFISVGNFNQENSKYVKSVGKIMELGSGQSCNYIVYDAFQLKKFKKPKTKIEEKIVLEDFLFASGSFSLQPESKAMLDSIYQVLSSVQGDITITGYTDNVGSVEDNKLLSMKRAEAVKESLISRGFTKERVTTRGLHELNPIRSNDTELGRSKNRRVEITIDED